MAKLDRTNLTSSRSYLFRGRIRCTACERKMQGGTIRNHTFYRCIARTLTPGSAALADHPRTVNLREDHLVGPVNEWIGSLFTPGNLDNTIRDLVAAQDTAPESRRRTDAERRLADAEAKLRRHQAAIEAGIDPTALVEAVNAANAERTAARNELQNVPSASTLTEDSVRVMLDSLGDITSVLNRASFDDLAPVYEELDLQVRFEPAERVALVSLSPRVVNECVRGGT
jgi:hypothetical protein